ncbi:Inosine/uridine-preferring nucleoside hydrolase domain-containing protein [Polychytrium aggregatum]|uniref:Inosine/uridine-preferring nucleoside hydrolase domain-containing protein n=1 Tax=Polychytrium aggregatum TaxID=110093 RepID=UPI0022FEAE33|nr:Inosine/uridine-preferring nucleoside hydrolase domain-containing protein [Polychytrium aggregatum]KAI9202373.1 Inosine/uridine-preferring nucleoside hydrolase domain-containing protein [Polychytrium aggregatum]
MSLLVVMAPSAASSTRAHRRPADWLFVLPSVLPACPLSSWLSIRHARRRPQAMSDPNLIVDSDFGIDDATALLLALRVDPNPLKAVTVVSGNVPVSRGVRNCRYLIALADRESLGIEVYGGATAPLVPCQPPPSQWPGHGKDGFGDASDRLPEVSSTSLHLDPPDEHAANALVRLVNQRPGHYRIVALGPLTNIALAITLDPDFLSKVASIVIMGGCLFAQGNSNRTAEFNFHHDPEAAYIVFAASQRLSQQDDVQTPTGIPPAPKLTLVPWETTIRHGFAWSLFDRIQQVSPSTPLSRFIATVAAKYQDQCRYLYDDLVKIQNMTAALTDTPSPRSVANHHQEYIMMANSFTMCDAYAMLVALDESLVTESKAWNVQIELGGQMSRGMMALDWFSSSRQGSNNTVVVFGMDVSALEARFLRVFA